MPYHNIVFVKLEKRLFNDHRWYMMSEEAQLNFIRLMLFAAESYNKIPKNLTAIKKAFKTDQDLKTIESTIKEIKLNFPKFKENKHFYYFNEFNEKTNYIAPKELLRNSKGIPKEATEEEEEEYKEEEYKEEKEEEEEKDINIFNFNTIWDKYPSKVGAKQAKKHFTGSVKNIQDFNNIKLALQNYLQSERVMKGYIQNGSTWFNNWKDWITPETPRRKLTSAQVEAVQGMSRLKEIWKEEDIKNGQKDV